MPSSCRSQRGWYRPMARRPRRSSSGCSGPTTWAAWEGPRTRARWSSPAPAWCAPRTRRSWPARGRDVPRRRSGVRGVLGSGGCRACGLREERLRARLRRHRGAGPQRRRHGRGRHLQRGDRARPRARCAAPDLHRQGGHRGLGGHRTRARSRATAAPASYSPRACPAARSRSASGRPAEALETVPLLARAIERAGVEAPVTSALARLIEGSLPLDDWVALVRAPAARAGSLQRPLVASPVRLVQAPKASDGRLTGSFGSSDRGTRNAFPKQYRD